MDGLPYVIERDFSKQAKGIMNWVRMFNERKQWVKDNCEGRWQDECDDMVLSVVRWYFELDRDATLFALFW